MRYALLQTDLNPPSLDQLRRAFRFVPGLTPYDANILGNDAFGILVKDFSAEQAGALQGALRVEGIETEIVDQSLLPALPQTKIVQRLECHPAHLLIFDPLGKSFPLEWRHIMLIAAGGVQLTEFVRHETKRPVKLYRRDGQSTAEFEHETVTRKERNFHLLCEIIITGAALRYSFSADKFNFACLGERNLQNPSANFSLFVRDLIHFCPHAGLNRGATALQANATEIFAYPTKNAFHEEIVWMLWQIRKAA
jgi:hypothetical protein